MSVNEEQTVARIERLRFIELLLYFNGSVNRDDLINRFGISKASASNLLSAYSQLAPNNLTYNVHLKRYEIDRDFRAVFDGRIPTDRVPVYTMPKIYDVTESEIVEKIARISRAIQATRSLSIEYSSASSGQSKREVVPIAFGDNLLRWHLRAFDRKRQRYADFVLHRIHNVKELSEDKIQSHEHPNGDKQWHTFIELKLQFHSDNLEDIASFSFDEDTLIVTLRAAMAGYFLQLWNVDCSPDKRLRGKQYQYFLANLSDVSRVANLTLAPGFSKNTQLNSKEFHIIP